MKARTRSASPEHVAESKTTPLNTRAQHTLNTAFFNQLWDYLRANLEFR